MTKTLYICFFLLVILASIATAQDKPTIKVVVARCEWTSRKNCEYDRLSQNQMNWWRDSGQKKYRHIQLVETKEEADWVLFWCSDEVPYTVNTPSTATTTTTRYPGTDMSTSQTTIHHGRQEEKVTIYVDALARKIIHKDGVTTFPSTPGDLHTNHTGKWLWSKPDKDAFEKLIKQIAR